MEKSAYSPQAQEPSGADDEQSHGVSKAQHGSVCSWLTVE